MRFCDWGERRTKKQNGATRSSEGENALFYEVEKNTNKKCRFRGIFGFIYVLWLSHLG